MKAKRIFMFFLAFVLAFSLIACDSEKNSMNTDTDTTVEETTPEEEATSKPKKEIVDKTYQMAEIFDNLKVFGRTSLTVDGLICDHTASGIEFNAYIEGDLAISIKAMQGSPEVDVKDCYFTLYIDGVRSETRFKIDRDKTTELKLATFAEGGVHNIRFVKQTRGRDILTDLISLSFKGYFEDRPADKEYLVEFIGDSLTVGYGNLVVNGTPNSAYPVNHDGTQAFAYLTAEKLGVDYSMVAASGIGVVNGYTGFPMKDFYAALSYYRSTTRKYIPKQAPDLVVINLGTNDISKGSDKTQWDAEVEALIKQVRKMYDKDIPIVWVYNMMSTNATYPQRAQNVINSLGGEAAGLYMCKVTNNRQGGGNHPNLETHVTVSTELAKFIQDKNLLK